MEEKRQDSVHCQEDCPPQDKEKGQKEENQERLFRHSRKDADGDKILISTIALTKLSL